MTSPRILTVRDFCDLSIERFSPGSAGNFLYIDVSAVDAARKKITAARQVPTSEAPSRAQSVVRTGDILVSTVRPALNAVALVPTELDGAVSSSAFAVLRCAEPGFRNLLFCYLRSNVFIDRLVAAARGAHYPAVADRDILDAPVGWTEDAPRPDGAKLAQALEAAGRASDAMIAQVSLASKLDKKILAQPFADVPPIQTLTPGVHTSNLKNGWRIASLQSLARLESGHTPSRRHPEWWGGDVPWLALPDIRKLHGLVAHDTIEHTNDLGLANSSARLLPAGTVCLCRDASIGFVTMLGRPMATSQHFCNWVCDPEKLDAEFLMYAFMASFDYLRELGSGSVLKTIYMPTIESFHLCAPPLNEQRRIAQQLRQQLQGARQLRSQLAERQALIERLPQRILADAFGAAD